MILYSILVHLFVISLYQCVLKQIQRREWMKAYKNTVSNSECTDVDDEDKDEKQESANETRREMISIL